MDRRINIGDDVGLVANAADPAQVESARHADDQGLAQARNDVRAVMSTREGRRAVRRWLGLHGVFRSITAIDSSALTYALSGRRDAGLEMLEDVVRADRALYLVMENEAHEDEARQREHAAARRAAALGEEDDLADAA